MPWPGFARDKQGKIEPTRTNIHNYLTCAPMCGWWLAYDGFLDSIVWAPAEQEDGQQQWRTFGDADYIDLLMMAERRGFKTFGLDIMRASVHRAATQRMTDTAIEWLERIVWDGVPRVHTFLDRYFGTEPTPYSEAVSRYIWTAHAGRVYRLTASLYGAGSAPK